MSFRNILFGLVVLLKTASLAVAGTLSNPIMFVTQFPISADFATIGSTFANHQGTIGKVGRGGDLYIRYSDGTVRNLTREAGYGNTGFQGDNSIAVRDPTVHWSGTKALFSMVIGAPQLFEQKSYYWQMYEITGFAQGQTIAITKIANQPVDYNNITPLYASDDQIIFTSDLPRSKNRFNYPQKDEYESTATNTGLWKLNPQTGEYHLLQHSPSGSFSPFIDSSGRLIFTRWDHLQRDQQASPFNVIDAFNYVSEPSDASTPTLNSVLEVFPEPRAEETDLLAGTNLEGHSINHFFPWQLNQDGTEEETLNHVGRHEFHDYFNRSINDDNQIVEFIPAANRPNQSVARNLFQLHEDPLQQGRFVAVDAPEFATHSGGQLLAFKLAVGDRPDLVTVDYLTHPETRNPLDDNATPSADNIGFSRDPVVLSSGAILASHTTEVRGNGNQGTRANPNPRYDYRLKTFTMHSSGYLRPEGNLVSLATTSISYYDPDVLVTYSGPLWELQAVEVIARTVPPTTSSVLPAPESQIFASENVDVTEFKNYLTARNLAVIVMRDVTTREALDRQQPFNLKVANQAHQTIGSAGQIYELSHMQFFQGDQVRGSGGTANPDAGQRVIAQYLHDEAALASNIPFNNAPNGAVEVYPDGSVALFVPASRAMAWQSLAADTTPVVRERYWISFQPGEIRACGGCHGVNNLDQAGNPANTQEAMAFRALLQHWKTNLDVIFVHGFE